MLSLLFRPLLSSPQWGQLLRLELHYEEAHEAIAAAHGPYYYLSFIGTAPEARGKGLGSKLLQEMTSRADREGRWCLLEATSEKSEVGWCQAHVAAGCDVLTQEPCKGDT